MFLHDFLPETAVELQTEWTLLAETKSKTWQNLTHGIDHQIFDIQRTFY